VNGIAVLLLAGALAAVIRPAWADTLETTLTRFGLLGHWAVDCGAAPSIENPHGLYRMLSPHEAELRYDYGPLYEPQIHIITFAEPADGNRLRIKHIDRRDGSSLEATIQKLADRIQNVSVVESDGKIIVKDGIYTLNGRPAVWLERCD